MSSGQELDRIDFWVKNNNLLLLFVSAGMCATFLAISMTTEETQEFKDSELIGLWQLFALGFLGVLGMRIWGYLLQSEDEIEIQCQIAAKIFAQNDNDNRYVLCSANLVEARAVRTTVGTGIGKRIAGISIGAGIARSKSGLSEMTSIDINGEIYIDKKGIHYLGVNRRQSWLWGKIIDVKVETGFAKVRILLPVENRTKNSGFEFSSTLDTARHICKVIEQGTKK